MLSTAHLAAEYSETQMEPQGIAKNIEGHLIAFTHRLSSLVSKICESWKTWEKKTLRSTCKGHRVFYSFCIVRRGIFSSSARVIFLDFNPSHELFGFPFFLEFAISTMSKKEIAISGSQKANTKNGLESLDV